MFTQEAIAGYIGTGIWTLINLFVIYLFLSHFLFKPFAKVINRRKESIDQSLLDAADKQSKAQEHEQLAQKQLNEATRQAADLVNEARQKALIQEAEILKSAQEQAQGILDRTTEETKRIRSNLYVDMRKEIADLSVAIASKVIGSVLSKEQQASLVDRYLQEEIGQRQTASDHQGNEANLNG